MDHHRSPAQPAELAAEPRSAGLSDAGAHCAIWRSTTGLRLLKRASQTPTGSNCLSIECIALNGVLAEWFGDRRGHVAPG